MNGLTFERRVLTMYPIKDSVIDPLLNCLHKIKELHFYDCSDAEISEELKKKFVAQGRRVGCQVEYKHSKSDCIIA